MEELEKSIFSFDYMQLSIESSSRLWRFLSWLLILTIPPMLCVRIIKRVLKEESNLLNAGLVLSFALPGFIAGWILCAFGQGWTGMMFTLLAVAASGVYSFGFLSLVEEARS